MPTSPQTRLPALDGVRAIAISLVLWQHAGILFHVDASSPFWRASQAGWWGVDLFFVLSGFLITRILLKGSPLFAFWRRRAARTLPLLYVYLAVAAAYGLGGGFAVEHQPWLNYLTHTTNLHIAANGYGLPVFGILWSLAVEEQFYFAWPFLTRWLRGGIAWACGALILTAPLTRWVVYNQSDRYAAFHVLPFCRADVLAMGCLLAVLFANPKRWSIVVRFARPALAPALAVLGAVTYTALGPWPIARFELAWVVIGYSLVGLSCSIIVAVAAASGPVSLMLLANPLARFVGRISYGMYLWHSLLAVVIAGLPIRCGAISRIALWVAVVLATSALCFYGIERPWLRQKLEPR